MKTVKLTFLTICVVCFSTCANSYSVQSSKNITPSISRQEIDFTSTIKIPLAQSGFDIGYGSVLLSNGDILATGGWNTRGDNLFKWSSVDRTWNQVKLPSAGGMNVSATIYFTDSQNGWVFKDRDIYQSRDGGETWKSVPIAPGSEITRLEAASFFDSTTGFIGGTTSFMNRETFEPVHGIEIMCTGDGGKEFRVCYKSNKHQVVHEILALKQQNTAIALIDGTALLITTNQGRDWTEKPLPVSVNGLAIDVEGGIWIVGSKGTFLNSHDLGDSWEKPQVDPSQSDQKAWNSIAFSDKKIGVAVGDGGIFAFSENGQDWRVQRTREINEDLYDVQIAGSHIVMQGKENIYRIAIRE